MKKEPWRITVFVLSLAFIVGMWIKKDIAGMYSSMELFDALPLIVTGATVTCIKVAILTGLILLIKWIIGRIGGGRK